MRRGEVWWVDFDPAVGGEIRVLPVFLPWNFPKCLSQTSIAVKIL
jgi:hypothetical protein